MREHLYWLRKSLKNPKMVVISPRERQRKSDQTAREENLEKASHDSLEKASHDESWTRQGICCTAGKDSPNRKIAQSIKGS